MLCRGGGLASPDGMIKPMQTPPAQTGASAQTPSGINRYTMCQRIFAMGQDFDIHIAAGQPAFKILGKVRVIKESLKFCDMQGITQEALVMIDEELQAIAEAERTIEISRIVQSAAILDTLATLQEAEALKTAITADVLRTLAVADLIDEAAVADAIDALASEGLLEAKYLDAAAQVEAQDAEVDKAFFAASE